MTNRDKAVAIARAIFALGDEHNSPCRRLEFKSEGWFEGGKGGERSQGGCGEKPLAGFIEMQLNNMEEKT